MRHILPTLALAVAIPSLASATDFSDPKKLEVGQHGHFFKNSKVLWVETMQVLGSDRLLLAVMFNNFRSRELELLGVLYVEGVSTKGVVDGKKIQLNQEFTIRGTYMYPLTSGGTKTVYRLSPTSKKDLAARIAAKARQDAEQAARKEAQRKADAEDEAEQKKLRAERRAQAAKEEAAREAAEAERKKKLRPLQAASKFKLIKSLTEGTPTKRQTLKAIERLKQFLKDYGDTPSAAEARKLLKELQG